MTSELEQIPLLPCPLCKREASARDAWRAFNWEAGAFAKWNERMTRAPFTTDAVKRLVEACRKVVSEVDDSQRSWDYTEQDAANDLRAALAAVEKEIQP